MPGKDRTPVLTREGRFWGIILLAFLLDIITKALAFSGTFDAITVLSSKVANEGVAFGRLAGMRVLIVIAGMALIAVLLFFRYKAPFWKTDIIIALLIGGALGNQYDRLRFGYVRDFIQWPTFNLADAFICIGVGFYIIDTLYRKGEQDDRTGGRTDKPTE